MVPKFRAWDKKAKEYFHISELWNSGTNPECFNFDGWTDNFGNKGRLKDIVIEQYTGMKDSNGKEIYEGDILLYQEDYGDGFFAPVIYGSENLYYPAFDLDWHYIPKSYFFESNAISEGVANDRLIVAGNIHTNLELLEDKK